MDKKYSIKYHLEEIGKRLDNIRKNIRPILEEEALAGNVPDDISFSSQLDELENTYNELHSSTGKKKEDCITAAYMDIAGLESDIALTIKKKKQRGSIPFNVSANNECDVNTHDMLEIHRELEKLTGIKVSLIEDNARNDGDGQSNTF